MKKILSIFLLLFLISSCSIMAQTPEVILELQQDSTSVPRDSGFSILVKIGANSVNLKSYSIAIQFDANLIRTHPGSITEGDLMRQPPLNYTTFFDARFSADSGTVTIDGANLEPGQVIDGGGIMAIINFESDSLNFGITAIEITEIQARDLDNQPLVYDPVNTSMHVCEWILGDANGDGKINVSDAVYIINYVFIQGFPPPNPLLKADSNCDDRINVSDAVYLINLVFSHGPFPCRICY